MRSSKEVAQDAHSPRVRGGGWMSGQYLSVVDIVGTRLGLRTALSARSTIRGREPVRVQIVRQRQRLVHKRLLLACAMPKPTPYYVSKCSFNLMPRTTKKRRAALRCKHVRLPSFRPHLALQITARPACHIVTSLHAVPYRSLPPSIGYPQLRNRCPLILCISHSAPQRRPGSGVRPSPESPRFRC